MIPINQAIFKKSAQPLPVKIITIGIFQKTWDRDVLHWDTGLIISH